MVNTFCSRSKWRNTKFLKLPEAKASQPEAKEQTTPPADTPAKEEPPAATAAAVSAPSEPEPTPSSFPDDTSLKNHEPHLGPKPRTHNRVLNPPGGKSSVVIYY
ncbi:unnamed protein product [Oreochromis niloticus]|nr:unnamed protein product [Mustela putorius furo]